MRTGAAGSSRAISDSFLAGIVMAPADSTSAVTSVDTAISRSVPEMRIPLSVVWTSRFARTGSVVFEGTDDATAFNPSCSFSREIVNRMPIGVVRVTCGLAWSALTNPRELKKRGGSSSSVWKVENQYKWFICLHFPAN